MISRFWPIGLLAIFNLIFFAKLFFPPSIFTSADFGRGDLTHFHYPLKVFLGQSLKSWQLPLWSDQIFGGFPVFAEGQIGALYLPNLVLFTALPTWLAFNLGYVLTFLLAAVGTYYYLQFLKLGKAVSLFGATAFSFSFFFVGHIIHYNLIQVASLIPAIVLFWEKYLARQKILDFAIFSFLVSQSIFASFYQLTFYTLLLIITLTIFRILAKKLIGKIKMLASFGLGVIFAFLLSAIQILASFEFIQTTFRGFGLETAILAKFPFPPSNIINFFAPYFFGDPSRANYPNFGPSWGIFWENAGYFGIIPVILALIGIYFVLKSKTPIFKFWLVLGFIGFLLVLGKFGPFFFLLELPPFNFFRVPSRFLFLVIFSGIILATFSLEQLTKHLKFKNLILLILIIITFADLYLAGSGYNGGVLTKIWLTPPDTVQFLKNQPDVLRIYSIGQFENWNKIYQSFGGWRDKSADKLLSARAILDPNSNLTWDISHADGYAATPTRRMALVKNIIEDGIDKTGNKIKISSGSARLLTAEGVSHLVTAKEIEGVNFLKVFESDWGDTGSKYYIFKNLSQPKLAKVFFDYIQVNDVEELAENLSQVDFEKQVILEEKPISNLKKGNSEVSLIKLANLKWEIKADLTSPGMLVTAISWYPGWRAEVNGSQAKIFKANANSQAVFLQQGENHIVLTYEPFWSMWGGIISLFSHIFLFGLFLKTLNLKRLKFGQSWKI